MDFNDILTMDLKELTSEHRTSRYKYLLYLVNKFYKYTKAILIPDKEADTVINKVYYHWIIGTNKKKKSWEPEGQVKSLK